MKSDETKFEKFEHGDGIRTVVRIIAKQMFEHDYLIDG